MKAISRKTNKRPAFTIIELLTIMSIIVILISLLVPALNRVKRYAKRVRQKAQFHSIGVAMNLFNAEFDGYPESDEVDSAGNSYCGAMKLAEAMVGQDLLGFHPDSSFTTNVGVPPFQLYPISPPAPPYPQWYVTNLNSRRGPYIELENANAYKLKNLYGVGNTGNFDEEKYVLCDVYKRIPLLPDISDPPPADRISGKAGMPILYYGADTSKTEHDFARPDESIYDYRDNLEFIDLGIPWNKGAPADHPMASAGGTTLDQQSTDPEIFYVEKDPSSGDILDPRTLNVKVISIYRPQRAESYILMSAGFDGEYGTPDDVFNFEE